MPFLTRLVTLMRTHRQRRLLRLQRSRVGLLVLGLVALVFLLCGPHPSATSEGPVSSPIPLAPASQAHAGASGQGAGGPSAPGTHPLRATMPTMPAFCNPFDPTCVAGGIASWAAGQIISAFTPLTDGILRNPADIVYQTPAPDSYQNGAIMAINAALVDAVDAALAALLAIGAYNVIWGPHLRLLHSSASELLTRLVLVAGAVHFNLAFLGLFIELENQLSLAIIHQASYAMLFNIIEGLFSNPIAGPLVWLLIVVLGIMAILLLVEMITRIALVAICLAVAPLGLGCLLLEQTMRWGRLWLTIFASSVIVQAVQVAALGLGGVLITAIGSTSLVRLDKMLATALLAIGVLGLVLKIPGMLQTWALHPMMQARGSKSSDEEGASSTAPGGSAGGANWSGSMGSSGVAGGATWSSTIVTEETGTGSILFLA